MNATTVRRSVIEMLSAETGCAADQLHDGQVHIVARVPERKSWPEHRSFNPHPERIGAATLGTGAVISVDQRDLEWAQEAFREPSRDELFRGLLLAEFAKHGKANELRVHGPYPRFTAPLSNLTPPRIRMNTRYE